MSNVFLIPFQRPLLWVSFIICPLFIGYKAFSKLFSKVSCRGNLKGLEISHTVLISHLLLVDNIFLFILGLRNHQVLKYNLECFSTVTRMIINIHKSCMILHNLLEVTIYLISILFQCQSKLIVDVVKYLGFMLKENYDRFDD